MAIMPKLRDNSDALMRMGIGLLSGQTGSQQAALGLGGFADARASAREKQEAQQKQNQTIEFLRRVNPQLAQAVEAGAIGAGDAYKTHLQAQTSSAPKPTDDMREYEFAKQQGYGGTFFDYQNDMRKAGRSSTNVTLNNGQSYPGLSKLGEGYTYLYNPDGTLKTDEQGLPMAAPVPGGKASIEAENVRRAEQTKRQTASRNANVVVEDIDRAIQKIEASPMSTTGIGGAILSNVPGTEAFSVDKLITTVKANAGFDRLQAMRDSSPTGGALGQVSEREMTYLQAAIGNLEQSQSQEELVYNLKRVRRIYDEIVNGPGAAPQNGIGDRQQTPNGNRTQSGVQWSIEP